MIIGAEKIRDLMCHKDDIIYGVISRAEHEVRAAALKGEAGCIFEYPAEYNGYAEIDMFYDLLLDNGYTVTTEDANDEGITRIGIYWVR